MKEYIEREAVMQKFADYVKRSNNSDFAPTPTWNEAVQIVEDAPAADVVEVKHAYWRDSQLPDQDNNVQCWCSACGAGDLHAKGMIVPYCWKCGAKMDGGAE